MNTVGYDGEKHFCKACGRTFLSLMGAVGHQRACSKKVWKGTMTEVPRRSGLCDVPPPVPMPDRALSPEEVTAFIIQRIYRLEKGLGGLERVVGNENEHLRALAVSSPSVPVSPDGLGIWRVAIPAFGIGLGLGVLISGMFQGSSDLRGIAKNAGGRIAGKIVDRAIARFV
jgi:hypothetical protein